MRIIRRDYGKDYFASPIYKQKAGSRRNNLRLNTIRKHKQHGHLLDIGCGEGQFLDLARQYYQTEGIDISDYAVNSVISKGHKASTTDITTTRLPVNSYDIISVFNILEHLENPSDSVDNMYAALKQDGLLIGSVPFNYGLIGGISTRLSNFFDRTHKFTPPPTTWRRIFASSGFSEINLFGEITSTKNSAWYLNFNGWQYFTFNLVFICHKF